MIRHALLLLALTAAGPAPAPAPAPAPGLAQDRPTLAPTRDAVVAYHMVPGSGEPIDVRVGFKIGGAALRVDLPDSSFILAIPATLTLVMVVPLQRTALEMPWVDGPQPLFLLDERMRFTRKGEATIAGARCTIWDAALDRARNTLCVSADGLVLRNQSQDAQGRRNLVEAYGIRLQSLPDSEFSIPADFVRLHAQPR